MIRIAARHAVLAALVVCAGPVFAPIEVLAATEPAAAVGAAAELKIAPIVYRERRLGNGLQVLSVASHASPTVSVQVWYRVGSRDDPPGRSGFAHLFEHMMFKGTTYLRAEQFDRLTEDVGGENNAATHDDATEYYEVVPSNHLESLLWAEAERMMNLKVDEATFKSERSVVEEEYRQRVLAAPYGRLFYVAFVASSYLQHPYKRPGIGRIEDLEAATLADVVAFHKRHYRPDNATLVVTGDFDPPQLDAWVDKYFSAIPRPVEPLPQLDASEPPWTSDRAVKVTAPQVPLPAVAFTWLAPPVISADAPALQVAAAVLAAGESSRLNQALVYRQRVATQAGFNADLRSGPGLLIAFAIAAGGKSTDELGNSLLAEVARLAKTPPSAAELAKVKTQLVTEAFTSRQTPLGLGSALAEAAVLQGDPARVNSELDDLQRVSAADVQRVLRRYVLGAHKVTIDYRQEPAAKP
jgi:zinc protease